MRQNVLTIGHRGGLRESICLHLDLAGYTCTSVDDSEKALRIALAQAFDVIVMDVGVAPIGGTALCCALRRQEALANIPIMMVTDRSNESEALLALEQSADDYMVVPLGSLELVARIRALLRRAARNLSSSSSAFDRQKLPPLVRGSLVIDYARHRVEVGGRVVNLTKHQFHLLWVLATHEDMVLDRQTLLQKIWGDRTYVTVRSVDALVKQVRRVLQVVGRRSSVIVTVRGVGYKFASERASPNLHRSPAADFKSPVRPC
jgi:DNA-binding response OmpR family regulator